MNLLVGSYDSDEEEPLARPQELQKEPKEPAEETALLPAPVTEIAVPEPEEEDGPEQHDSFCECADCEMLMLRFMAKNLQTKGIRFKCKLCNNLFTSKVGAAEHFRTANAAEIRAFKKEKMPRLFKDGPSKQELAAIARKKDFERDRVLGKRFRDEDEAFGGWAKKEKPPPPPCEMPDEGMSLAPEIFVAPPWEGQRPSDDDATEMDRELDRRITQSQTLRFCKRNVLEVKKDTVRCKLCYKTLTSVRQCEEHIGRDHEEDFKKELKIWERFLFTTCKRQPPFGWTCKICQVFFASDGKAWRHVGKEVYVSYEERHMGAWHEKEDRWGHAEDEECCGDGINSAGGLSYESVLAFNKAQAEEEARKKCMEEENAKKRAEDSSSSSDEEPAAVGKVQPIEEF
ncbi:unnamed protein product [Effrenium voratum]|uniref:Uncharacterized protein n=1 Tax=Effrenium voratum TaxID=2562239 RepID=A0AA36IXL0_9DINO|nr:unnamed protein product [Effrenium voratum]CAJ1395414.1 unnamed protein product [Effrenium voratum]CAJ1453937.1 unnamed protein product [Effrenium voratum]